MDGKVLGVERRRRWNRDEKARIVEETLMPGAVVCEVARRHGVAQSLLFTWRRQARTPEPGGRDGSILLPVEIGAMAAPSGSDAARQSRAATSGRRTKSGVIEIELGSGSRVRVDNEVDVDALRRVLSVLSER
jgi:transposase